MLILEPKVFDESRSLFLIGICRLLATRGRVVRGPDLEDKVAVEEMVKAEAQLELLKELWIGSRQKNLAP